MECLRSFNFQSAGNVTASFGTLNVWGIATTFNWLYDSAAGSSSFEVQGFKNINIYKLEVCAYIQSTLNTDPALVEDWSFFVRVNGQNPVPQGFIGTINDFGLTTQFTPLIPLGKYNPSFTFATPITSVGSIQITNLWAQGTGAQGGAAVNLNYTAVFNVFYKFEGE
jgi:hypothetical protein